MASIVLAAVVVALPVALLSVPSARRRLIERLPPTWHIAISAFRHGVKVADQIFISMPDGSRLASSLYLPKNASGPFPTVLIRLPYHRLRYAEGYEAALFFARHGYAALVQDLRGTGDSEGELLPWRDAAEDGMATLDWIARQPWSSGKIGTFGCSALGETQLVLGKKNHPAHLAMIPSGAGGAVGSAAGRYSYFGLFEGGVFQLASGFGWFVDSGSMDPNAAKASTFDRAAHLKNLPVSGLVRSVRPSPNGYTDFLSAALGDPKWEAWGYLTEADVSQVPALVISTWGDQTVGDTLALAEHWRRTGLVTARDQKVVIAPGKHCGHQEAVGIGRFGELPIENASRPYEQWYLRWFDHWLRGVGDGLADLKPYSYFMLVENSWLAADQWPPSEAQAERWHLGSTGHANSRRGDGVLTPLPFAGAQFDTFAYDPINPVPSRGGPICCTGNPSDQSGPADQTEVESRDDVLVYTSAALEEDLRIAGPLKARISFSSSAPDTDLVARLVHVWPDGKATSIQEGASRVRYRGGFVAPVMMEPGHRYEILVDMRSIAYKLPKGHRLRLQITSSSFPRLERNLNTGSPNNADESRSVVAINKVHHDQLAASWIEMFVLPPPAPPPAGFLRQP